MNETIMISPTLFKADNILFDVTAGSQKQLFQEIATNLIETENLAQKNIACRDIVAAAAERERLGSTGVGNGVALPHARLEGIEQVSAVFAKLAQPLEFDSVDDRDVDLVAFLLAPSDAGGAHLRALAKVSRILRRQEIRARLRAAPNAEALHIILTDSSEIKAA
jgi:PTS system nitrogen regulatory IIA component